MVRWFSPLELARTSAELIAAYIVTRFVDPRINQHELRGPEIAYLGDLEGEFWFDYVADAGDGWNPTFAVARTLAADELELREPADTPGTQRTTTHRGDLLVLGGDLVYPTPRNENYERRLVAPYREACAEDQPDAKRTVFAIPGNHDWYDGLRGFTRLFCHPGSRFAGWTTRQTRSYFALALPQGWWLIGVDVQLGGTLDRPQEDFFRCVATELEDDDRVILCLARPEWLEPHASEEECGVASLMDRILENGGKSRVRIYLAGHRHHYQRHVTIPPTRPGAGSPEADPPGTPGADREGASRTQHKITAGGGGAYLSPTHIAVHRSLRNSIERRSSFPPESDSRRYRARLLFLPFVEWTFGFIPAALYALGFWVLLGSSPDPSKGYWNMVSNAARLATGFTGFLFLVVLFLSVLMFHQRKDRFSLFLAGVHCAAHLFAIPAVSLGVLRCVDAGRLWQLLAVGALGWLVGSVIVGVYLLLSSFFDRFVGVAFAALRIDDWKSFLRFHIAKDGTLTIFPIGLRRVPRQWSRRVDPNGHSELDPEDPRATDPELIETPIRIEKP